jgi:hypothetical protein
VAAPALTQDASRVASPPAGWLGGSSSHKCVATVLTILALRPKTSVCDHPPAAKQDSALGHLFEGASKTVTRARPMDSRRRECPAGIALRHDVTRQRLPTNDPVRQDRQGVLEHMPPPLSFHTPFVAEVAISRWFAVCGSPPPSLVDMAPDVPTTKVPY